MRNKRWQRSNGCGNGAPGEGTLPVIIIAVFGGKPQMASDRDSKVIGYFAYVSPAEVVCTGDACVISGSESAMRDYLIELNPDGEGMHTIRKTRFGEIMFGIRSGAAYAFDEEAYSRFYPLAREAGLHVAEADFETARSRGDRFFTVRVLES